METGNSQNLIRLLAQHHQALHRYLFALLGNAEDANDVLQETSVALFLKLDQFDDSKPFLPWAYRFAYLEVLKWREKISSRPLLLDTDVVELLACNRESEDTLLQRRMSVLRECFQVLPSNDVYAIRARYFEGIHADDIAKSLGQSRRTLFRELERIRKVLMDCIDTKLEAGET